MYYLCKMKDENPNTSNSAEYLKGRVIDFFIQQTNDIVIGNEVMYGISRRVVDLLIIKDGNLIAIEIKGDGDDLRRLGEQIEDYRKIFDYIIVFTTENHLKSLLESSPNDIGIYLILEDKISRIRASKKQRKHAKIDMLYTINAKYLSQTLNLKKTYNSDEIRQYICKQKGVNEIKGLLHTYFHTKTKERFALFLSDRGTVTHIDDIPILSSNIQIR